MIFCCIVATFNTNAATVVATVGGKPVTDTDITARTKLMALQGNTSTDNRRRALQNIIDDYVKLNYASNFNTVPSDKEAAAELSRMNLGGLSESERAMALNATKANIAWQIIVGRTIVPTIDITDDEINAEKNAIAREHGLPIEMTMIRLYGVPEDIAKSLPKPDDCDDAIRIAENYGGAPQKFTVMQYDLAPEVRSVISGLPKLTWSRMTEDHSVFLVCNSKKSKEYGQIDNMIKQNAIYKQAMFIADQQLKQLRRKAVVVINDPRYKL